uniref:Integral membrane protein n=1 Tax=Moniliophthora roreri TaxID=221103 RepID=A0A0W0FBR2_MONRR
MAQRLSTPALLFITAWAQMFLYGCNVILFGVGMLFLLKRRGKMGTHFHLITTSLLVALITIAAVVTTVITMTQMMPLTIPIDEITGSGFTVRVDLASCTLINLVMLQLAHMNAYVILLYRCYHIWNRSIKILSFPLVVIIAESIFYWGFELPLYVKLPYVAGIDPRAYAGVLEKARRIDMATVTLSIVADSSLTLLIGAGRIWWVKRELQRSRLGQEDVGQRQYDRIIAMMCVYSSVFDYHRSNISKDSLESGIINPIGLLTLLGFTATQNGQATVILASFLPQMFALAPLLITVRVGLGLTVEEDQVRAAQTSHIAFTSSQEP